MTSTTGVKTLFKLKPCLACNDGSNISESIMHDTKCCEVWGSLSLKERQYKVYCLRHPFSNSHKMHDCETPLKRPCNCGFPDHRVLLCPVFAVSGHVVSVVKVSNTAKEEVLLKTLIVKGANNGQSFGCLQDNASTDNFVTHKKATDYNLKGHNVVVEIEGIDRPSENLGLSIKSKGTSK